MPDLYMSPANNFQVSQVPSKFATQRLGPRDLVRERAFGDDESSRIVSFLPLSQSRNIGHSCYTISLRAYQSPAIMDLVPCESYMCLTVECALKLLRRYLS